MEERLRQFHIPLLLADKTLPADILQQKNDVGFESRFRNRHLSLDLRPMHHGDPDCRVNAILAGQSREICGF